MSRSRDQAPFVSRSRESGKVSLISVTGDDSLIKLHSSITVSPAELAVALGGVLKSVAQLKGVPVPLGLESLEPCAASKSIAEALLAGDSAVSVVPDGGCALHRG